MRRLFNSIAAIICLFVAIATTAISQAVPLLSVDFGRNIDNNPGNPSPVQPGFLSMSGNFPLGPDAPPPSLSQTFGSYAVTISGDPHTNDTYHRIGFEDTAANSAGIDTSIRALFQDAFINNLDTNVGHGLNLSIQGVTPNTQYALKVWSYNADNFFYETPTLFEPKAGSNTTGTSGSIVQLRTPLPTSLDDYSATLFVSSTTDTLDIHAASTDSFGGTRWNGFQLSVAVPEPSTGALMITAIAVAAARRRVRAKYAH